MANGPKLHGEFGKERFTEKQWLFICAMVGQAAGNGTKAAEEAGYKVPMQEAHRLLRNAEIRQAITDQFESSPLIASRNERLAFLTSVVRGEVDDVDKDGCHVSAGLRVRISAAELMASMQGDLKLKVDMRQEVSIKDEREEMKAMINDIRSKQTEVVNVH